MTTSDGILTWLFLGTIKGVGIEWFLKQCQGSIKSWSNLVMLFLAHFFEDDVQINMHTLLRTK